eukprot:397826-Amphidinium_carterae.1
MMGPMAHETASLLVGGLTGGLSTMVMLEVRRAKSLQNMDHDILANCRLRVANIRWMFPVSHRIS